MRVRNCIRGVVIKPHLRKEHYANGISSPPYGIEFFLAARAASPWRELVEEEEEEGDFAACGGVNIVVTFGARGAHAMKLRAFGIPSPPPTPLPRPPQSDYVFRRVLDSLIPSSFVGWQNKQIKKSNSTAWRGEVALRCRRW